MTAPIMATARVPAPLAAWRLLRMVVHLAHGVWIAKRRFPAATLAQRQAWIRWWSAKLLRVLGLSHEVRGDFSTAPHLLVANHVSWLDIIAIHAVHPQARFVSKADVRHWPVLGVLVERAGTLFIERESKRDALRVVHQMAQALREGEVVAVFPEGTTGDGHGLLPFHANLLQAAVATGTPCQPVALRYADAGHAVSPSAMWIGDTTLAQSLWRIASCRGLGVRLDVRAPVAIDGLDRRALAARLGEDITAGLGG